MKLNKIFRPLKRYWIKLRLKPIDVYVFHMVSETYNPLYGGKEDWISIDYFQERLLQLQKRYKFITLSNAINHIKYDKIRFKRYAVLTADDGYQMILPLLPWLKEHNIPVTLFINTRFLEGDILKPIHIAYLTREYPNADIQEIKDMLYMKWSHLKTLFPLGVEVGMHGHNHLESTTLTDENFRKEVHTCYSLLKEHTCFIPFFAYPWGRHNAQTDAILKEYNIIPVLMDGMKNYNDASCIHRELLDNYDK